MAGSFITKYVSEDKLTHNNSAELLIALVLIGKVLMILVPLLFVFKD